jgi:hypothetical protein
MENRKKEKSLCRSFRIIFWLGLFVLIPLLVWILVFVSTDSSNIAFILAVGSFVIYSVAFFLFGIYVHIA